MSIYFMNNNSRFASQIEELEEPRKSYEFDLKYKAKPFTHGDRAAFVEAKANAQGVENIEQVALAVNAFMSVYGNEYEHTLEKAKVFVNKYLPSYISLKNEEVESKKQKAREAIAEKALAKWREANLMNPLMYMPMGRDHGANGDTNVACPFTKLVNVRNLAESHVFIQQAVNAAGKEALEAEPAYVEAVRDAEALEALKAKAESNNIFEVLSVWSMPENWTLKVQKTHANVGYISSYEYIESLNRAELVDLLKSYERAEKRRAEEKRAAEVMEQGTALV